MPPQPIQLNDVVLTAECHSLGFAAALERDQVQVLPVDGCNGRCLTVSRRKLKLVTSLSGRRLPVHDEMPEDVIEAYPHCEAVRMLARRAEASAIARGRVSLRLWSGLTERASRVAYEAYMRTRDN